MKILVTGGAGFIGSHFVRAVLAGELPGLGDARVTVLDKLTYAGNFASLGPVAEHKNLDFVPGDIADPPIVEQAVRGADAIVNFAAEARTATSALAPADFARTNVAGVQVLLDAARKHEVGRTVLVSAGEVYGPVGTGASTERSALAPTTPYAATKAAGDLLGLAFHRTHGLPVVITRGATTYGPYQHPEKLIPRYVTGLLRGRTVPLYGDGGHTRDWIHVDDHTRGIALALTDGKPGEIYHLGGTGISNRDLADRLVALCDADPGLVESVPDRPGHDHRHALDDDHVRTELGYRPRVAFDDGLAATVDWYRHNEQWWRPLVSD